MAPGTHFEKSFLNLRIILGCLSVVSQAMTTGFYMIWNWTISHFPFHPQPPKPSPKKWATPDQIIKIPQCSWILLFVLDWQTHGTTNQKQPYLTNHKKVKVLRMDEERGEVSVPILLLMSRFKISNMLKNWSLPWSPIKLNPEPKSLEGERMKLKRHLKVIYLTYVSHGLAVSYWNSTMLGRQWERTRTRNVRPKWGDLGKLRIQGLQTQRPSWARKVWWLII